MEILQNKKGNIFFSMIIALLIFIVGMIIVNFVKLEVNNTYASLSCGFPDNLTDGTKILCLITDSVVPYWFILVLSIALGVITEKLLI